MSVTEFTASNIAMDIDGKEDDKKKPAADYTKIQAEIDEAVKGADKSTVHATLDKLLGIEKQQRLGEDVTGTRMACTAILELLYNLSDWNLLNEHILLLAKRRSQLKQVVLAFVKQSMGYINKTPSLEVRVELIKTLQTVTEGKIYVEIERARLTKALAKIKEEQGDINEAASILQEVAVETYGAMAKAEKIAFILEQVRLCLEKGDFVRANILSRKISPRAFKGVKKGEGAGEIGIEGTTIEAAEEGTPSMSELKMKYYNLLIQYHAHSNAYAEICSCYMNMLSDVKDDSSDEEWMPILKKIVWYAILAPIDSHRTSLLTLNAKDQSKRLAQIPAFQELLKVFTNEEIIWWWKIKQDYETEITEETEIFGGKEGPQRLEDLQTRVTQHNIMIVSKYYSRVKISRLAVLLDLEAEKAEKAVADFASEKKVHVKIDRPSGILNFRAKQTAESLLNDWSRSINTLLGTLEKSCQQIQKEAMVHKVVIGKA